MDIYRDRAKIGLSLINMRVFNGTRITSVHSNITKRRFLGRLQSLAIPRQGCRFCFLDSISSFGVIHQKLPFSFLTMLYSYFLAGLVAAGLTSAVPITTSLSSASSIWVTQVPTSIRPYAIAHYNAGGCIVGQQYHRFPVTGLSSNNAFTLISTNAPGSTGLGILPHTH